MTSCYKRAFTNRVDAARWLRDQKQRGGWRSREKGHTAGYAYECAACGAWHLTSQPKRRRAA